MVREIRASGSNAIGVVADVSSLSDVDNMIQEAVHTHGPLNLMVANAGIIQAKPLLEVSQDDWVNIFKMNARGIFNCYTGTARTMIKRRLGGEIVGAAR